MFASVACLSVLTHAGLIWYGRWQDEVMAVKFTDVDYWVLSDAAELMLGGKSPFDRPTFRYSPLLAFLLMPNAWFGELFGKFLFSSFDILCGWLIYSLLGLQSVSEKASLAITTLSWLLNPIVLAVSTRGNAESFVCALVLGFIWCLAKGRKDLAAFILGLGVHVKMFPILFLPTVLIYLGVWAKEDGNVSRSAFVNQSAAGTPKKSDMGNRSRGLRWKHVKFLLITLLTFTALTFTTFILYGQEAIEQSILYHLTRKDHRHNFSPYWLYFYHTAESNILPAWSASLPFIPQFALIMAVAIIFGKRDFCFACFLQTFIFVSFNKYFLWYLAILPVTLPVFLQIVKWHEWLSVLSVWMASQGMFLGTAYKLEFVGAPVFEQVWMASLMNFLANLWIAGRFIKFYARARKIKQ